MEPDQDHRDNLTRLLNLGRRKRMRVNRRYSFIVRSLRLILPLAALAIVVVVMAWPKMDDSINAIPREDIIPQKTGRNELINPRFESANASNQQYVITASRAVQSMKDSQLVLLEKPVADIALKIDEKLSAQADRGVYKQESEILVLDGGIHLKHDSGYTMESERLNISLKDNKAWTDRAVTITGPAGTLQSAGMTTNNQTGETIFTGPIRLTLTDSISGL